MKKEILNILETRVEFSRSIHSAWNRRRYELGISKLGGDNFEDTDVYRFYQDIKKSIESLDYF